MPMMGLTDRIEPWARRFQRATAAPEPEARSRRDRDTGAATEVGADPPTGAAGDEPAPRRTGRFARRVVQER
jgi:hypothetical protein